MMDWQPIETLTPEPWGRYLCWAPGWKPTFLVWKTNNRITQAHSQGEHLDMAVWYFGDEDESDDYHLALPGGGPTLWFPLPETDP